MSPHIFLVAGEESGDRLGAALMEAIRQRTNGRVQFSAVGGAHMAAAGVPSLFPLGDLAIIGFAAIPASLPKILQRIRALRGGQLNDARFGVRMQGEGVFADQIAALFTLGCRKAGLQRRDFQLSTAAFRRPIGAQLSLFS